MITLKNERGETIALPSLGITILESISFPPGGMTIRELLASFGDAKINQISGSLDSSTATGESGDELHGLIEEPAVQAYPLIIRAGQAAMVGSLWAKLSAGTASLRLLIDGNAVGTLEVSTTLADASIGHALPAGGAITLEVTAEAASFMLAFSLSFT